MDPQDCLPSTSFAVDASVNQIESSSSKPDFLPLTLADLKKLKTVQVDIDSFIFCFSMVDCYKPGLVFEIDACPQITVCQNIKFLDYVFGATRKNYKHLEFCLGGDSFAQLRVLVSVEVERPNDSSDSEESDEGHGGVPIADDAAKYPYQTRFMELVVRPAILKLPLDCNSRLKGAGSSGCNRWYIHRADWATVAHNMNKNAVEHGLSTNHVYYVASHGLKMCHPDFLDHLNRYVYVHHASVLAVQVHVGIELDLESKVRGIMARRDRVLEVFKGVKFYPGFTNFDHGHFKASSVKPAHNMQLPAMTYLHAYNPAVHIIRRGLSNTSLFTWLMLGGEATSNKNTSKIVGIEDVRCKFFGAISSFLRCVVRGPALGVEAVLSDRESTEVLKLLPTYGSRLLEFVVASELVVKTDKAWPSFVDGSVGTWVRHLQNCVEKLDHTTFDPSLLATVYDVEKMVRFWAYGESRWLDSSRLGSLFPLRQIRPGHKKMIRRSDDGWVPFSASNVGAVRCIQPKAIYGDVLIHPCLRNIIASVFNCTPNCDIFSCSMADAAITWIFMLGSYISDYCNMGKPQCIESVFSLRRLVRNYQKDNVDQYRTLSVCGSVDFVDVYRSLVQPKRFVACVLYNLFSRRTDFEYVKNHLRDVLERHVEVIPVFLISSSSFTYSDWMFVGPLDPRSTKLTKLRAEMLEAKAPSDY